MNITQDELILIISAFVDKIGDQIKAAKEIGVTQGYLSAILNKRRSPGKAILDFFGFQKVVTYEQSENKDSGEE